MKHLSLLLLAFFSIFFTPELLAVDASPVPVSATDGTGFRLKERFNQLYAGQVTAATTTYAASVALDFGAAGYETITLTGNITFTTTRLVAGRTHLVRLVASGGTRTLTFPAGWIFVGAAAPASLASGKTGLLHLRSFSTDDANVVASFQAQP